MGSQPPPDAPGFIASNLSVSLEEGLVFSPPLCRLPVAVVGNSPTESTPGWSPPPPAPQ